MDGWKLDLTFAARVGALEVVLPSALVLLRRMKSEGVIGIVPVLGLEVGYVQKPDHISI